MKTPEKWFGELTAPVLIKMFSSAQNSNLFTRNLADRILASRAGRRMHGKSAEAPSGAGFLTIPKLTSSFTERRIQDRGMQRNVPETICGPPASSRAMPTQV